jgi:CobQ-like glutamine amidotransferase family enzyme
MSDDPMSVRLTIGWLYPAQLSTYGDRGNVLCLVKRAQWRGITSRVVGIGQQDEIPKDVDILFIGGGQDRAQAQVAETLVQSHGSALRDRLGEGVALLAICGGFQLLCHEYVTLTGGRIPGIGIFDAMTRASNQRLVGDVRMTSRWGTVVGFENHSGQTYLASGMEPLGRVELGHGNNGEDRTEGVLLGRAVGSYLHGALLPRNPGLADWLLLEGLRRTEPTATLGPLLNHWVWATHLPFQVKGSMGTSHRLRSERSAHRRVTHDAHASAVGSPGSPW